MFDQRIVGPEDLPKPAQWHRIAVHNDYLGAYAVQKLVKNAAVYVEGDIETRVYNDSINDQVKNIPEKRSVFDAMARFDWLNLGMVLLAYH
uniref:Single-stranded DNA-binding protein n=1 Tax=Arundo donax TaxID=35708 RepID=A0A0A9HDU1_ARUDO